MVDDPLLRIGPKANDLWKPVVAAGAGGMACGRGLLPPRRSRPTVADDATFFTRTPTYGMVSAYESVYAAHRMYGRRRGWHSWGTPNGCPRGRRTTSDASTDPARRCVGGRRPLRHGDRLLPPQGVQGTVRALDGPRGRPRPRFRPGAAPHRPGNPPPAPDGTSPHAGRTGFGGGDQSADAGCLVGWRLLGARGTARPAPTRPQTNHRTPGDPVGPDVVRAGARPLLRVQRVHSTVLAARDTTPSLTTGAPVISPPVASFHRSRPSSAFRV